MDRKFWIDLARDWGVAVVLAAVIFAVWTWLSPGPPTSGPAPDFTLTDASGEEFVLSEQQGQTVVLNFWATWCGPCVSEIPELSEFHAMHPEVAMLGVSVDEGTRSRVVYRKAEHFGATYPIAHDASGLVGGTYAITTLPTTVVVDPDGQIRDVYVGSLSRHTLEELTGVPHSH